MHGLWMSILAYAQFQTELSLESHYSIQAVRDWAEGMTRENLWFDLSFISCSEACELLNIRNLVLRTLVWAASRHSISSATMKLRYDSWKNMQDWQTSTWATTHYSGLKSTSESTRPWMDVRNRDMVLLIRVKAARQLHNNCLSLW